MRGPREGTAVLEAPHGRWPALPWQQATIAIGLTYPPWLPARQRGTGWDCPCAPPVPQRRATAVTDSARARRLTSRATCDVIQSLPEGGQSRPHSHGGGERAVRALSAP